MHPLNILSARQKVFSLANTKLRDILFWRDFPLQADVSRQRWFYNWKNTAAFNRIL